MKKLGNIELVSSKVELIYLGTDSEGATAEHTLTLEPDTAWTALLCRYIEEHRLKEQYGSGGRQLSMIGSAGDRPRIDESRWNPNRAFTG